MLYMSENKYFCKCGYFKKQDIPKSQLSLCYNMYMYYICLSFFLFLQGRIHNRYQTGCHI